MNSWDIAPGAPRESILRATARFNLWHGPIRSGKTIHSLIAWLSFIPDAPREGQLFMVGKTEDTLERNILKPTAEAMPGFRYNKGKKLAWYAGREINLLGANDNKAESRVRGVTGAGFYFDELTLLPQDFIKQCQGRMSPRQAKAFATTNPDGPYHPVKVDMIDRANELGPRRIKHFTWPIDANPFLDPVYVEDIKAEYQPGTLWYKRFIDGLWVAAEGAVYDFFDESRHRLKVEPDVRPGFLDVALDYGTANATAAGLFYGWHHPIDGMKTMLKRTYYHSGKDTGKSKTDAEYARELITWLGNELERVRYIIVDPSAASFKAELRAQLAEVRPLPQAQVIDAHNDVIDGIRNQARLLKSGAYKIGPDKTNDVVVRDYGAYLWDSKAQERGEDKPLKQHDHTKDFERYYLFRLHKQTGASYQANRRAQGIR